MPRKGEPLQPLTTTSPETSEVSLSCTNPGLCSPKLPKAKVAAPPALEARPVPSLPGQGRANGTDSRGQSLAERGAMG